MKIKIKMVFFFLIFCFTISQTKSEYISEEIEEAIPKNFFFDRFEDSSYKILKYSVFCNFNSSTTNVSFQIFFISNLYTNIDMYDNFNSIKQKNGYFIESNFTKSVNNPSNIFFNNLICNKDYYFIISIINPNTLNFKYYQVLILSDETNAINLNPSLSDYYYIAPRKDGENLIYKFNEDKIVNIEFIGNKTIKENNIIIYDETKGQNSDENNFEFKKGQEYNIYLYPYKYSSFANFIKIYFINSSQSQILKYDFDKKPLIIKIDFPTFIYEMDISNYDIGEYIVFQNYQSFNLKYQYKSDFKKNNFIILGVYLSSNFITIKKTKNDSSILLNISPLSSEISILSLYKLKMTEITDNYEINSKGPKFFYIDYYQFNKFYSFGVESNQNFYFLEQIDNIYNIKIKEEYNNNFILIKQSKTEPHIIRRGFIVFNSNEDIYLKIQKFNYSIFDEWSGENPLYEKYYYEYFQICQGESTPQELYFYIDNHDYFKSIFGNYSAYFIKEKDINTLSDFDFNKINETNLFHFSNENGFLKIKCRNPAMLKHSYFNLDEDDSKISKDITSGKRYIINKFDTKYKYHLSEKLVNEIIPLKISLLGNTEESSILLNLDNKNYTLNNSISLEINYKYDEGNEGIISFVVNSTIEDTILIEIIVGFIKEDLDSFKIVDFIDSFGNRELRYEKGIIIKIPKDLNEDLFDFLIRLPSSDLNNEVHYDFQIIYDKIEFIVPIFEYKSRTKNVLIPLFKNNPYLYLSEKDKESNDKFFYILIYNNYYKINYSIKKPKSFSPTEINTIYKLPKLNEEEEKYYYKIYFPKGNYSSLIALVSGDDLKYYLSINSLQYEFTDIGANYFNIPIDKNDIMNNNSSFDYFGSDSSDSYIIFNPKDEVKYIPIYKYSYSNFFSFNMKVNQIREKNQIQVNLNSYAYYIGQLPCKYYILINYDNLFISPLRQLIELNDIFSIIYDFENSNLDKSKNIIKILEDNGENNSINYEIKINKNDNLKEHATNNIIIIPFIKENIVGNIQYIETCWFNYIYYEDDEDDDDSNTKLIVILTISGLIIIIIAIIIFFYIRKKKKDSGNLNSKMIENTLMPLQ